MDFIVDSEENITIDNSEQKNDEGVEYDEEAYRSENQSINESVNESINEEISQIAEKYNEKSKVKFVPAPMRENKTSQFEIESFDAAFKMVCDPLKYPHDVEEICIEDSLNRVLAGDLILKKWFPPFRTARRNGYAVLAADDEGERRLKADFTVNGDISDFTVQPGEAVRVSAGGCIPKGADAVVPVEDTTVVKNIEGVKEIKIVVNNAHWNQYIKSDWIKLPKDGVFSDRETITAKHIEIFAVLGYLKVKVYKRARIAILSTGDALYSGHSMRNSNNLSLLNLLKTFGYSANDFGIVKYHPDSLKEALNKAFLHHDIVITTGGVSVAEYELMKEVLEVDFAATIQFGRVNMEPGYWTTFATCNFNGCSKFVFSLPGDFSSVIATCRLFVIPALCTYENSKNNTYCTHKTECCRSIQNGECRSFKRVDLEKIADEKTGIEKLVVTAEDDNISSRTLSSYKSALLIVPENTPLNEDENSVVFNIILDAIMLYS